jgi:hypothetical protein
LGLHFEREMFADAGPRGLAHAPAQGRVSEKLSHAVSEGCGIAGRNEQPGFTVEHEFRSSHIEEDILIYQDFGRVDFEARIDWRGRARTRSIYVAYSTLFATPRTAFARTEFARGRGCAGTRDRRAAGTTQGIGLCAIRPGHRRGVRWDKQVKSGKI